MTTQIPREDTLNGAVLDYQRRIRDLQDKLRQRDEDVAALKAFVLDQAQLIEEIGLVARGVYRTARQVVEDRSL